MTASFRKLALIALTCAALAGTLFGQIWDETTNGGGDAGELPGTAKTVGGSGPLTAITGNNPATNDRDLYRIRISNPAAFSATTDVNPGTNLDTQLYLFTTTGVGIAFNDDISGTNYRSTLPLGNALYNALPAGEYLLGVAPWLNQPQSAAGLMFPTAYSIIVGPTGVGGGTNTLSSWIVSQTELGTYRVTLTGCEMIPMITVPSIENFDQVTPGNLPAGWTAGGMGHAGGNWTVGNTGIFSGPNVVIVGSVALHQDRWIQTPPVSLNAAPNHMSFRLRAGTEASYEGLVLDISVGGGPWTDIVLAGGSFLFDGYNGVVHASSTYGMTIAGRAAWTGLGTTSYHPVILLPASAANLSVSFRWRYASDSSVAGSGAPIGGCQVDDVAFDAPLITGVSPNAADITGGTVVTVTGLNLGSVTSVAFVTTPATPRFPPLSVSPTSVTFVMPAMASPGIVPLVLAGANGFSDSRTFFSMSGSTTPTVASVVPPTASRGTGTLVTITGTNFVVGATQVFFNSVAATGVAVSAGGTSLTCTTPANNVLIPPGPASVNVVTAGGGNPVNSLFTFTLPAPTMATFPPTASVATGPTGGGYWVRLAGTQFYNITSVTVGATPATAYMASADGTLLSVQVPAGTGAVPITVTTTAGSVPTATTFTYLSPAAPPAPTLVPNAGPAAGGTRVKIYATTQNFVGVTGVTFGGTPATIVETHPFGHYVEVVAPAGAGTGQSVIVTNAVGSNAANTAWSWAPVAPTVTSLTAASGSEAGFEYITVTGTGSNYLAGVSSVTVDGVAARYFDILTATTLRVAIPPGAPGASKSVVVVGPGGTSVANTLWTYNVAAAPTVLSLSENIGPVAGGTTTYIYGNNFITTGLAVTIGGAPATNITLLSRNIIRCVTPAGTAGPRDVTVTTSIAAATLVGGFVYGAAPQITSPAVIAAVAGTPYAYTITTSGSPTPALLVSGLPGWLTKTGNTLSGTPQEADIGTTGTITVTAFSGFGSNATQPFQIVVSGQAPVITSIPVNGATIGMPYSYFVTATGIPAPVLSAGTLPTWLSFNSGTGELSGTPQSADFGLSAPIVLTAANGWTPDGTQNFQIQVNGIAPQITSTAPTTVVAGTLYSYTIITTGDPAPVISVSGNPAWLTLSGNVLSGTPGGADVGLSSVITLTAANGELPDAQELFQIDVTGVAPLITSSAPTSVVVGSLYTYTVVATGTPTPSFSASGLPAWLTLVGNILSGTPAGADVGTTGVITITASNGVAPDDDEAFQVTVNGTAPTFTSTAITAAAINTPYSYTATATGLPTPTMSVTSALPAWLTFNAGTGTLSGTPTTADGGTVVNVTLTASNGVAPDATQTFTIGVAKPKDDDDDNGSCTAGAGSAGLWLLAALSGVGFVARRRREGK